MSTTLIHNLRRPGQPAPDFWILIQNKHISAIGTDKISIDGGFDNIVDGKGALALPGVIDCHVHFREPGMTEKADIASESRAAIAGGVTSYLEMPNTKPSTTSIALWEDKMALGEEKSLANYGFFIGATNDNVDELKQVDYTRVPGVKLFMGSSTGNMLVDKDDSIARLFREVNAIVAVHAEDQDIIDDRLAALKDKVNADGDLQVEYHSVIRNSQACYNATLRAVKLAKEFNRRLHICHLTTAAELSLLQDGPTETKLITSEVSPHHLMWNVGDYATKGSLIKMNPAVKDAVDQRALREALESGLIDMVATDHAPHLLSQKSGGALKAVSGAPLVQFSLPWMLSHFDESTVRRVMCNNPAKVFGIDRRGYLLPGCYADITLVEKTEPYEVSNRDVISKCGWTPLEGETLKYRVAQTWVNGQCVYDNGKFRDVKASMPLRFNPDNQDANR